MKVGTDSKKSNLNDGSKVKWHPLYNNWLITSDNRSIFNFYCTDYTNNSVPFENIDITENNI